MAVDERRRRQLQEQLTSVVGSEATATMMELLPPDGQRPASADQVAELSARLDRGLEHVNGRIDRLEISIESLTGTVEGLTGNITGLTGTVEALAGGVDRLEHRVDAWELRLDAQTDRLTAAFRQELLTAVSGQTRAIILTVLTTLVGTATLALAFAQLG